MPVDVPSSVEERADRFQWRLEKAREESAELEMWLTTGGVGYIKLIIAPQLTGLFVSTSAWMQLMARAANADHAPLAIDCELLLRPRFALGRRAAPAL